MDSALEGYTLLHISDLKGASYGANQSRIRFALQKEDFDAVVLTGDMVSSRGNAQPLYTLIEMLHELKPGVPIYMIPGDKDPLPASMSYAASGSPFAPWVLGARRARRAAAQRARCGLSATARAVADNQRAFESGHGYDAGAV